MHDGHRDTLAREGARPADDAETSPYPEATEGLRMIAWSAWAGLLILPLLNESWINYLDMRYLGFLLPMAYVALGAAFESGWHALEGRSVQLRRRWQAREGGGRPVLGPLRRSPGDPRPEGRNLRSFLWLVTLGLALYPLVSLWIYYAREEAAGRTNDALHATVDVLDAGVEASVEEIAAGSSAQEIFIDKGMRPIKLEGGGDPTRAFEQLLFLRGIEARLSDVDELRWFMQNDDTTTYWMILAEPSAAQLLAEGFPLETRHRGSSLSSEDPIDVWRDPQHWRPPFLDGSAPGEDQADPDADASRPSDWLLVVRLGQAAAAEAADER